MAVRYFANQFKSVFKILIVIIGKTGYMHKTLYRIWQLDIHSIGCHPGNNAFIDFSDMLCHILCFFQLLSLTLCLICPTFCLAGMLGYFRQNRFIMRHPLMIHPAPQCFLDNTVYL